MFINETDFQPWPQTRSDFFLFKQADLSFTTNNAGRKWTRSVCLMDCLRGDGLPGTKISTSWDSSTKEGRNSMFSFMSWWMWEWGRSVILEGFLPSVSARYTHFPSTACHGQIPNTSPLLSPTGRLCTYSANAFGEHLAQFFFYFSNHWKAIN